jgi:hypothetical protein
MYSISRGIYQFSEVQLLYHLRVHLSFSGTDSRCYILNLRKRPEIGDEVIGHTGNILG